MKKQCKSAFLGIIRIILLSFFIAVLVASCALEPEEFIITFNPEGGTGNMEPASAKAGQRIILPKSSFANGTDRFEGWIGMSPQGEILEFDDQAEIEMTRYDLELFARWDNGMLKEDAPSKVGSIGPSGGYIFYDKGSFFGGWQYMEAAPANIVRDTVPGQIQVEDPSFFSWGAFPKSYKDENNKTVKIYTTILLGAGKRNTESIVAVGRGKESAAKRCDDLVVQNGTQEFDDWFLPSSMETLYMKTNLFNKKIGGICSCWFWTSTEAHDRYDRILAFDYSHTDFVPVHSDGRFMIRAARMY